MFYTLAQPLHKLNDIYKKPNTPASSQLRHRGNIYSATNFLHIANLIEKAK